MRMLRTLLCSDSSARYSKKLVVKPSLHHNYSVWGTPYILGHISTYFTRQSKAKVHLIMQFQQRACLSAHILTTGQYSGITEPR